MKTNNDQVDLVGAITIKILNTIQFIMLSKITSNSKELVGSIITKLIDSIIIQLHLKCHHFQVMLISKYNKFLTAMKSTMDSYSETN